VANDLMIPFDQDNDGVAENHWFNVVYHPLQEEGATSSGVVVVANEVTTQVLSRKELELVNRELEEFAYVASHDLQEPLRMVSIYTQLLLRQFPPDEPSASQWADIVRRGVQRLEALIRDLLSYSRSIQKDEFPAGRADLSVALAETVAVLRTRITETGAVILADPLPVVRGETPQLALVFQNLISNALKYCRPNVPPEIRISTSFEGDSCTIVVRDNGIGFEQQYAERIFGLFKRLHKEEYPGTGLGLAICPRIIERYGGRMWAQSAPGEGASFYFSLPRSGAE